MLGHSALLSATLHSSSERARRWSRFIQQLHCAIFWLKAEVSLSSPASLQHTRKGFLMPTRSGIWRCWGSSAAVGWHHLQKGATSPRQFLRIRGTLELPSTALVSAKPDVLASRRNNIRAYLFSETLRYPYTHLAGCALRNHLSVMSKPTES